MANEEALGPRKTMFVLVIVVGCFAVLWPRILSPLLLGSTRDQLKPNQFDRDAGCCEVMFASEVALLELVTEVCNSAVGTDGRMSPYAAAECRRTVNETCGVDIATFMKKSDNVGKTTKRLVEAMQSSNSSCLRENFGVNVWSMSPHIPVNSWQQQDTVKQERTPVRGAPHPALRERGRAIPAGAPTPPSRVPVPLPPHVRVRSSPLSVYFEVDFKPPPIPGMRPPLGSPGGPVTAPKSSMGFVMPIYTICIIVFFVYTLSKILFKRTGTVPYDQVAPDPQFHRRVFRDESRSSPETKLVVTAISGLVAEVQQQMEASYEQNQQRQEVQDNHSRPYTNGSVHHNDNNAPIRIIASEYVEPVKEKTPEPEIRKEPTPEPKEPTPEPREPTPEPKEPTPEPREPTPEPKEPTPESKETTPESEELSPEPSPEPEEVSREPEKIEANHKGSNGDVVKENTAVKTESDLKRVTEDFLEEAKITKTKEEGHKQSTPELLKEALEESEEEEEIEEEESEEEEEEVEPEKSSVKVVGMEMSTHSLGGGACAAPSRPSLHPARRLHEAEDVKSIYLQTDIPQQSKVLVAEFTADKTDRPTPTKHAPLVVSGKMTLSLIQDRTRDTPERDPESTVDDFTTASAVTEPNDEKKDDLSDEELEEEIEIEEIEEETEEEEEEDNEENKPKGGK